ncbi:MAG: hypothetical protein BGO90_01530 [Legionella sp. 40-6]|nr:MAG: hypothetical protein BGO90_01530 [Legionella sp. 40-6]
MDIYGNENSWIAVKGSNGQEAYTKTASMRVDANGLLVTSSGKQVLGAGGTPIAIPPARSVDIAPDGTITVIPQGGDARSPTFIDRIKMVKLDKTAVLKNSDGLFQLKTGGKAPVDGNARLSSGALEGSNVQAVDQMVTMIHAGRDFESHMNLLSTMGDNLQKLTELLGD